MGRWDETKFEVLKGETLTQVDKDGVDSLTFTAESGKRFKMSYYPDCCASCTIEDICGDLDDLIGSPILLAEEVSQSNENPPGVKPPEYQDSYTWTFYKLATVKGSVTIRWYGESNGYYSESVTFEQLEPAPARDAGKEGA